jgi:hypothetical protein
MDGPSSGHIIQDRSDFRPALSVDLLTIHLLDNAARVMRKPPVGNHPAVTSLANAGGGEMDTLFSREGVEWRPSCRHHAVASGSCRLRTLPDHLER